MTSLRGSDTFAIGGTISVSRLGFGAMRITGPGIWGDPPDRPAAIRLLRRAVELGVDFIDTADSYGPHVSEELIREALHPYGHVMIATKGGLVRPRPGDWVPVGRMGYLRQCVEMSLRRLGVEAISLYQLHRIDTEIPLVDQVGTLADMREEGKIIHIGLSQVTVAELCHARMLAPIVSVQNSYNLFDRACDDLLEYCRGEGLAFIPWSPVAAGQLAGPASPLHSLASEIGAPPAQVALAWLLHRSPTILPIPGTSSVAHLEENMGAATLTLTPGQIDAISAISPPRNAGG